MGFLVTALWPAWSAGGGASTGKLERQVQVQVQAELCALMVLISSGDQDAFARFYDATCTTVFGMATGVYGDTAAAEAWAQEVYVAAWKASGRFDTTRQTPTAWLTSIAVAQLVQRGSHRPNGGASTEASASSQWPRSTMGRQARDRPARVGWIARIRG